MCRNSSVRLLMRLILDGVIFAAVCCTALIFLPTLLPTFKRGFFCGDTTLHYPYTETLLSQVHMTLLVVAVPAALILIIEMLRAALVSGGGGGSGAEKRFQFAGVAVPPLVSECYNVVGVYLFGLALLLAGVEMTQRLVGRLRPYFFDVCQPHLADGSIACVGNLEDHVQRYIEDYECHELAASAELLASVRHSFPSRYAAVATYAMAYCALYLQARLTSSWLPVLRSLLQFACASLAFVVALERVSSYRHHWTDVLAGALMGGTLAAFATIGVASLFRRVRVKARTPRDDANRIYGYYGVQRPNSNYFYYNYKNH